MCLTIMERLAYFIPKLIEIRIYQLIVNFFELKENMCLKSYLKSKVATVEGNFKGILKFHLSSL